MSLALFDLDNTLLAGDSDHEWGQFLVDLGIVDRSEYEELNHRFYEQYKAGTLDILEFCRFSFAPLAAHPLDQLQGWREQFIHERIKPMIAPGAEHLLTEHREAGDELVIITATNRFVTEPIARLLGVEHLLATEPHFEDGRYTGELKGVPCFQGGKVTRLEQWLNSQPGRALDGSWFYSDSHNDLPLLERVAYPVAVDPDEILADTARARGWKQISLRDTA
ncbi:HAD family phosphatase [Ectothiorhodospira sp. BSL-9]|uniref:histidinol-phosphatase n=1 Tax=Ectothiorhodospira sp. BSL-9 TaxID=1442136 RepID=UPI0007B4555C|nr:HAD family phosphatase [Ectothiorhodospira sp. BSL-9]ANB02382.1 phosphoserine phosphatase [Ectothiorhodospira sp. BSL-9]TVQ68727.1 MAG: HAD-IB family hydrolase [Chromatiaceae bacterium]